jgi:hypothetical protein
MLEQTDSQTPEAARILGTKILAGTRKFWRERENFLQVFFKTTIFGANLARFVSIMLLIFVSNQIVAKML